MTAIRFLGTFRIGPPDTAGRCPGIGMAGRECVAYIFQNAGRALDRDLLIERFWSNDGCADARGALNTTVSRLRRGLKSAFGQDRVHLEADQWSVRAVLDASVQVDSLELETVIPRLESGILSPSAALLIMDELYRGHFLPGCSGVWTPIERERLLSVYVRSMIRITDGLVAAGELEMACDSCRAIFSHDPLRERTHRRFMLLLAQQGDLVRALSHFKSYATFLASECDADPTLETQEVACLLRKNPSLDIIEDRVRAEFSL